MSLVEAAANVVVGYGLAVLTQVLVFPAFGVQATLAENLQIGAAFTGISILRSFALRRLFEAVRVRAHGRRPAGRRPVGLAGDQPSIR
jgi:hypothetical protein